MVVLVIAAVIAASTAIGVTAERRRPRRALGFARRSLTLILYVIVPIVVFFNLAHAELDLEDAVGLVFALVAVGGSALVAGLVSSLVLHLSRPQVGAVVVSTLVINSAYMGYPLTVALLGGDELPTAVLFDVLVCVPALLLGAFAVGAAYGDRSGDTPRQRVGAFFTRNPPLYAAVAAVLAPSELAPQQLVDLSQILIVAVLPIGFFAVGATLAANAEQGDLPMPPKLSAPVIVALLSRLVLAPVLLIALSAPFVDLPSAYLLIAAMSTGVNSLVVANAYGLDMEIVAETIAWSTTLVIVAALVSLLF